MAQILGRYKLKRTKPGRSIRTGRTVTGNTRVRPERESRSFRPRRRTRLTR